MSSTVQYFVLKDGQQFGPYDTESLLGFISQGQVAGDDLVWWDNSENWVALKQTPHLFPPCEQCGESMNLYQEACIKCGYNRTTGTQATITTGNEESDESKLAKESKEKQRLKIVVQGLIRFILVWPLLAFILFGLYHFDSLLGDYLDSNYFDTTPRSGESLQGFVDRSYQLFPGVETIGIILFILVIILTAIVFLVYPWHLYSALPRPDGKYTSRWGKDFTKLDHNLYYERIWRGGKLVFWKQWIRPDVQDTLYQYGFRQDGTTTQKLKAEQITMLPIPYRVGLCPKSRATYLLVVKKLGGKFFINLIGISLFMNKVQ